MLVAVVVLALLVVLVVLAELVGRPVAEERLASELRRDARDASVDITGPLFLPQAVRGRYDQVDVRLEGLPGGTTGIDVASVDSVLRDVSVPPLPLLAGDLTEVDVADVDGVLVVREEALTDALDEQLAGVGTSRVRSREGELSASVVLDSLPGAPRATLRLDVGVTDGVVRVAPVGEDVDRLPAFLQDPVRRLLDVALPLPLLPYGVQVDSVRPQARRVVADLSARDVTVPLR